MALPNPINSSRYAAGAPVATGLISDLYANELYLDGLNISSVQAGGAPLVLNGSFESPAVATSTTPDDWTFVAGTGGAGVTISTDQNHGAQSFKITRDTTGGHSGGTLTSSSFFQVSPSLRYQLRFMLKCNRTDFANSVAVNWYAADQSFLSTTTPYATSNTPPTSWTVFTYFVTPPATAMFGKIVITGGDAGTTPAATSTCMWDGLAFIVKPAFSEQTVYTSSNTLTVPSGAFLVKARIWGGGSGSGYSEKTFSVRPGDSVVTVITNTGGGSNTLVHTPSSTSITVTNRTLPTTAGTATGGTLNQTGGSLWPTALISLEY